MKQTVFEIIEPDRKDFLPSLIFDCAISALIVLSVSIVFATTFDLPPAVFKNAFSGLWWAVATLSTVGYGDIYPVTVLGRIFGAVLVLFGVAAVAVPTSIMSSGLIERVSGKHEPRRGNPIIKICPYCGKPMSCTSEEKGVDHGDQMPKV